MHPAIGKPCVVDGKGARPLEGFLPSVCRLRLKVRERNSNLYRTDLLLSLSFGRKDGRMHAEGLFREGTNN